ncbi:uncharacterized protein LOC134823007 isoform X2 [Bolinopsis microptera]|uniref:uncharacterized protein LOC134823007 isoform X2 n=1 Tax=Bolinopsis microptera TaxID=2820187 RepID=UPI00307A0D94
MLRNIPKLRGVCSTSLITPVRTAAVGQPDKIGTYQTSVLKRELEYKRRRKLRDMIKAERQYVGSLPGISSDEYRPSLEPGTINLRSMHPVYHSPQLRSQTPEQTAAAWAKITEWQEKITAARGTDRLGLVSELFDSFKLVYVVQGDPKTDLRHPTGEYATQALKLHGIVRGIEGYMVLNVADDEELEETCIELSGCTWMPQVWAGGRFMGDWRHVADMHNDGPMVAMLEGCGLSSKLKGCYYEGKSPLVKY